VPPPQPPALGLRPPVPAALRPRPALLFGCKRPPQPTAYLPARRDPEAARVAAGSACLGAMLRALAQHRHLEAVVEALQATLEQALKLMAAGVCGGAMGGCKG